MRKFQGLAVLVLVTLICSASQGSNPECERCNEVILQPQVGRDLTPEVPEEDLRALVGGLTAFGLDLYRKLSEAPGNLLFSPYNLYLALGMAHAGARGETALQMSHALHFILPQQDLHPTFDALSLALKFSPKIELYSANAFWGQRGYPFRQEYVDALAAYYGAEIHLMDFQTAPEACRECINCWVRERTRERIKELLPKGSVDPQTRLVLTSAIYFRGRWAVEFDPEDTFEGPFTRLDGSQVTVPFMASSGGTFHCVWDTEYQAMELPYSGGDIAMVIILPKLDFREFEDSLGMDRLKEVLDRLSPEYLRVVMPKFSTAWSSELQGVLASMGMTLPFTPMADFSGMGDGGVYLGGIYHTAWIKVDEWGTEAAAATGGVLKPVGVPREFRIDRPFIFLIRDRGTGTILFLGRVLDPRRDS